MTRYPPRRRSTNVQVLRAVLKAVRRLDGAAGSRPPSFNEILVHLKSHGVVSNHRSLRAYLDLLLASKAVRVRSAAESPNLKPRQEYAVTGKGPFVEVGYGAMTFYGLGWETPSDSLLELQVDLEGVARGTLFSGTLFGSLEDTVVGALSAARGAEGRGVAETYSAALLATARLDEAYLVRRAKDARVDGEVGELLAEIWSLFYDPRLPAEDVKTLYAVRRERPPLQRKRVPRWTIFSPDGVLDVVGKQMGLK